VILAAADALNWFAGITGEPASTLTRDLGPLQAPDRTLFLPYLGGERTPHNDAHIRGSFLHLGHHTDQSAMTRAVLEGVTHAFRDSYDALTSTGTQINRLNLPIELPVAGDFGGAFGAARLGMMAATGAGAELATPPQIARTIEPDTRHIGAFAEAHARYRASYSALKGLT
jgi:xylulokinase